jgi:hypothetical protein
MFYGRGAVFVASAAVAGGSSISVSVIGACGRRRVPPADAKGTSVPSGRAGGVGACQLSHLCRLRAADGLSGHTASVVVGAIRALADAGGALPLPGLPWRVPAAAGSAGRGTRAHQRFLGTPAGVAGRDSPVSAGGTSGRITFGSDDQPHGCLAGGAAFGTSGRQLQRRPEPVSRRQPQRRRASPRGPGHRAAERGWVLARHAGARAATPQDRRGETASPTAHGRGSFPRGQDRGSTAANWAGSAPIPWW